MINVATESFSLDQHTTASSFVDSTGMSLYGADLQELVALLQGVDPNKTLGGLKSTMDEDGDLRWVCMLHLDRPDVAKRRAVFTQQIKRINGKYDADNHRVTFTGAQDFQNSKQLCAIINNGIRIDELIINDCVIKKNGFLKILETIKQSFIQLLTLNNVTVCGQKQLQVLTLLAKTLSEKKKFLTLYVIKSQILNEVVEYMIKNETNTFVILQLNSKSYIHVIPALDYEWKPIPVIKTTELTSSCELRVHQMFMDSTTLKAISRGLNSNSRLEGVFFKKVEFAVNCEDAVIHVFTHLIDSYREIFQLFKNQHLQDLIFE
ncbi:unnamed protein product [Rotaria sp. Silwood1]|nr:unnamed protein product [Rotaria sp. Silwood1]